jgi:serine phosphatase RsbU (regulator of sigma subunit)/ligand-binding sensor domain-containing protein
MSSKRCILCFLLMLSCVCAAWSQENEQRDIPLISSDFTAGVVIDPGWSIRRATAEVVQEGASAGRYCLRIATTKGENSWDGSMSHRAHVLRKGKVYTLAAYLRSPDRLRINLSLRLAEEPWTGYGGQSFTMTDTWQEYHVTTPPMPEDVSPARFYFHFAYDTGEFYIDSVRFYEGEYVPHKPEGMGQIEGRLMMLDDKTPHVAVPVQAICRERKRENEKTGKWESEEGREQDSQDSIVGQLIATTLSDDKGIYRFMILKPGEYQLRCQVLGGYVYYQKSGEAGAGEQRDGNVLQVKDGVTLRDVDFRFAPFKKGNWRNYDQTDGLAHPSVTSIYCAPNGEMWFGTGAFIIGGEGASRYDGRGFTNFTAEDGLASNWITAIHGAPDGTIWFGTEASGISRYDARGMGDFPHFTNFTTEDGLVSNRINAILCDGQGVTWFGTDNGVSRYDGTEFDNPLTGENRLASSNVRVIHRDPDGVMWFGTDGGAYRYDGSELATFNQEDGLLHNDIIAIYRSPDGIIWFGTNGGVYQYDGREFANFATRDGLVHNFVRAIYCDHDGVMWFGTDGGVSRYDGVTFVNFTIEDGLIYNSITTIQGAADGAIWFGATGSWPGGGGISRYDEKGFANFTTEDGLTHNQVIDIHFSRDDNMWVGTGRGVARYDGRQFYSFATPTRDTRSVNSDSDGTIWAGTQFFCFRYNGRSFVPFMNGNVTNIYRAPDDSMWVAKWDTEGLYRYDGEEALHFTKEKDGLVYDRFAVGRVIDTDADGMVWLGTWGGISRYDGTKFHEPLTQEHGLADNRIAAVCCAENGMVWFGTMDGLSRYDGTEFTNFTNKDGLASNEVRAIHFSTDGIMWCGTSSGVSLYDGNAWSSLDTRDGLAGNHVVSIQQDSEGFIWLGTEGGLTRYRRDNTPPYAQIVSLTADRIYTDLSAVPDFSVGTRVTIEYKSIDLKTLPGKHQYRCRVYETGDVRLETSRRGDLDSTVSGLKSDVPYNPPTRNTTFDWTPEKPGTYTFQVQAIDRDLNYSEPANLALKVVRPFYLRAAFLIPTIGSGAIVLAIVVFLATALTKRRRQVHAYQQLAVRELRDARDMQMALLPEAAPPVEGMEIAGRSIPANTVGGDFFDYLTLADGKAGIALADISGKGLRAAMNAVMTSGMLYEVVKTEMSCGNILSALNAGLYPRMEKQTFAAFSFAILDQNAGVIQWSNAAQPLPMIKQNNGVSEADEDGQLPLGMAPDVTYPDYELRLQVGDTVVFYTDGIIEAENEAEEMYGTDRLMNLMAGIDSLVSAEGVIEAILQDVAGFVGDAERYDDMTIVTIKKL